MEFCETLEKYSDTKEFLSSTLTLPCEENISLPNINDSILEKSLTITDGLFFKLIPKKCKNNTIVASCVYCEPNHVEIKGQSNASSNFLCHLKRKHGSKAVNDYKEYVHSKKLARRSISKNKTPSSHSKKNKPVLKTIKKVSPIEFKQALLKFIVSSMIPMETILNKSFYSLMQCCQISQRNMEILTSDYLNSEMEQSYQHNEETIKLDLKAIKTVFCTVNVWSVYGKCYLTITAHWITDDIKRKSVAVYFQKLESSFNAHKINNKLNEVKEKFGLQNAKVATLVGDFNCLFTCAMQKFKIYDHDEEDYTNDIQPNMPIICPKNENIFPSAVVCRSCPVQILIKGASFDVSDAIASNKQLNKKHTKVMKKCNILWNHPQSENILREVIGSTLTKPNANDWKTVHTSLKNVLKIREKSVEIFQAFEKKSLNADDFLYIEELLECTSPLIEALNILKCCEHTFFGSLLSTLLVLRLQISKLLSREWAYVDTLVEQIYSNVNKQFQNFYSFSTPESITAALATFSHPEFKNRWLSCVNHKQQAKLLQVFKEAVTDEFSEETHIIKMETVSTKRYGFFDFGSEEKVIEAVTSSAKAEKQVYNYFNDPNESLSILIKYPQIKEVFLKYNTPLSSFVTLERMFDFGLWNEVMLSDRQKNVERRILLKANITE